MAKDASVTDASVTDASVTDTSVTDASVTDASVTDTFNIKLKMIYKVFAITITYIQRENGYT